MERVGVFLLSGSLTFGLKFYEWCTWKWVLGLDMLGLPQPGLRRHSQTSCPPRGQASSSYHPPGCPLEPTQTSLTNVHSQVSPCFYQSLALSPLGGRCLAPAEHPLPMQGAAHLQHTGARVPDRPGHQAELDPRGQTRTHCLLLLRCHPQRLPNHQPWGCQGPGGAWVGWQVPRIPGTSLVQSLPCCVPWGPGEYPESFWVSIFLLKWLRPRTSEVLIQSYTPGGFTFIITSPITRELFSPPPSPGHHQQHCHPQHDIYQNLPEVRAVGRQSRQHRLWPWLCF